ncbi:MAG: dethiobiotin synthase [Taibaiella sp.]|nr:dethiobiotin synthase [Taibaiella sp.]
MNGWQNTIAIAGIHTGIGKTIASAVIAEAIDADYWKPVQAGVEERDAATVRTLITDGGSRVHPEAVVLQMPASPHTAAAAEGLEIDFQKFNRPETDKLLLVETAGGVHSPMGQTTTMADFIAHYHLPTLLVSRNYLGSINHTLMSIEVLRARGINILGLVMNGERNDSSETFIEQYGKVKIVARVPDFSELNRQLISDCAKGLREAFTTVATNI